MRRAFLLVVVCACGARSEIAGSDVLDGSMLFDATSTLDGSKKGDGSPFGGDDADTGGLDAASCADVAVAVGCAGPNPGNCDAYGCKFNVEAQCGGEDFRVGGSCTPADGGSPGMYQGVCDENGKQTSTFNVPTTTCDCKDASALITEVQEKCAHQ
jgi:hypothetical protein